MTPRRLLRGFQIAARRMVSDWPVVAAALATVVLSAILLSAGPIYGEAITVGAFARAMEDAEPEQSAVSLSATVPAADFEGADRLVGTHADRAMGAADGKITAIARASILRIVSPEVEGLAEAWHVDGIDGLATLTQGRWPSDEALPEVALPESVAATLGVGVGDTITLGTRSTNNPIGFDLEVVGIYAFDDPSAVIWFGDPLVAENATTSGGDVVYGPLIAGRATILGGLGSERIRATWRVVPDFLTLDIDDIGRFGPAMSRIADTLNTAKADAEGISSPESINFSSLTRIQERLGTIDRSLTVTSSTILAVILQLSLLAIYALVLTSRLVVDTRTHETALARSRGASPTQVAVPAFFEGLLLAIPAVLAGPPIASRLVGLLAGFGPLAEIGLTLAPRPNQMSYALAAAAAGVAVLTLLWPAFKAARAFPDQQRRSRRTSGRSAAQKLGIDLALVALLAIAIWQLGELGPRVSATVRGRFGVDPLLVVAPALGLATGVVLALRIIPRVARASERVVAARVPAVPALAMWQIARRPDRYSRSALLLMTAVALGVFASSFSASWATSQNDQASHQIGADVRFLPRTTPDAPTDLEMRAALEQIDGVRAAIPVLQFRGPVTRGLQGRFFLTDVASLSEVIVPRRDIAGDLHALAEQMAQRRALLPSIEIPGEPTSIRMVWEAVELPDPERQAPVEPCPPDPSIAPPCFHGTVSVVVQDGNGLLHRLEAGHLYNGHGRTTLEVQLVDENGQIPVYPVSLVALEFSTLGGAPDFGNTYVDTRRAIVSLIAADAVGSDGSAGPIRLEPDEMSVTAEIPDNVDPFTPPRARLEAGEGITVAVQPGLVYRRLSGAPVDIIVGIAPAGNRNPRVMPIVATDAILEGGLFEVGMSIDLRTLGLSGVVGEIIGTVPTLPGVEATPPLVIVGDFATYQALRYRAGQPLDRAEEYWVSAEDPEAAAAAIAQPPILGGRIEDRVSTAGQRMSDPIALGTVGAFAIGFVSAAVFAVIGFTISALVSAREREREFSLLRALGLKRGQLGRWLLLEQAVLVVISLVLGLGVGLGIGEFLLPLVTLNQDGSKAVPDLLVVHDWSSISIFQISLLATLAVVLGILVTTVARRSVASALRFGDEP